MATVQYFEMVFLKILNVPMRMVFTNPVTYVVIYHKSLALFPIGDSHENQTTGKPCTD